MEDEKDLLLLHQSRPRKQTTELLTSSDDDDPALPEATLSQEASATADENNKEPLLQNEKAEDDQSGAEESIKLTSQEATTSQGILNFSTQNIYYNTDVSSMVSSHKPIVMTAAALASASTLGDYEKPAASIADENDAPIAATAANCKKSNRKGILKQSSKNDLINDDDDDDDDYDDDELTFDKLQKAKAKEEEDADAAEERKRNKFMQWRRDGVPEFILFEFGKDDCPTDDESKPKPKPPKKHRIQKAARGQSPIRIQSHSHPPAPSAAAAAVASSGAAAATEHSTSSYHEPLKLDPPRTHRAYKIRHQQPRRVRSASQERSQHTAPTSISPTIASKDKKGLITESGKKLKKSQNKITKLMKGGLKKAKSDMKELKAMVSRRSSDKLFGTIDDKKATVQESSMNEHFAQNRPNKAQPMNSSKNMFLRKSTRSSEKLFGTTDFKKAAVQESSSNAQFSQNRPSKAQPMNSSKNMFLRKSTRSSSMDETAAATADINSSKTGRPSYRPSYRGQQETRTSNIDSTPRSPLRQSIQQKQQLQQRQRRHSPRTQRSQQPPGAPITPLKSVTPDKPTTRMSRKDSLPAAPLLTPNRAQRQQRAQQGANRRRSPKRPSVATRDPHVRRAPEQTKSLGGLSTKELRSMKAANRSSAWDVSMQ